MSVLRLVPRTLRNLFHKDRVEADLDDEIRSYLAMTADDLHRRGLQGDELRRQALLDLGGLDQVKEEVRDVRAGAQLDQVRQDIRHALRSYAHSPLDATRWGRLRSRANSGSGS